MTTYLPIVISGLMFVISLVTLITALTKNRDSDKENSIKVNMKLDQLCTNTNQILLKVERQGERIQELEKSFAVLDNKLKDLEARI